MRFSRPARSSTTPSAARLAGSCLLAAALASTAALAQSTCNGHAELCSKPYSNVTYIGAHNSYSVSAGSLAANQNYDVTTQLDNGIRLLQNQGHDEDGAIHLCHSSCLLLDAGGITDYLGKVKAWLDDNPNEVITILWVNQDNIPVANWAQAYQATGLDAMSYVPTSTPVAYSAWPTLQELISAGIRVVSFMDYGADYSSVSYILDHFTHFWETPFSQTDSSFPCTVDRGDASTQMYMMNHYLDKNLSFFGSAIPVPDTANLASTNGLSGPSSLGGNAAECAAEHGLNPTFALVDFYDIGDGSVFEVAANLNGVSYTATQMGNGTVVGNPSDSTSSGKTSGVNSNGSSGSGSSSTADDTGAAVLSSLVDKVLLPLVVVSLSVAVLA